jgi:phosphatidylglycerophosphatase GEP4
MDVTNISCIDWTQLKSRGFQGVIFDKDNTLTEPYKLNIHPDASPGLESCRSAFGDKFLCLYSNSAGLTQYDPDGEEANHLEAALNIHVLRHKEKKPGGGSEEVEAYFGCTSDKIIMVGDRYLTDIVFGNRHGMMTVRVGPFNEDGETKGVGIARRVEEACTRRWKEEGVVAPGHDLLGDDLPQSFIVR